jgi:hypothetical protein
MTRYHLDPVFDRTLDGAVKGIIRYDIYLDGQFVGSRRTHALLAWRRRLVPSDHECPPRFLGFLESWIAGYSLHKCFAQPSRCSRSDPASARLPRMV